MKKLNFIILLLATSISIFTSCGKDPVLGCNDPNASNYNANVTESDGTCTYPGCTDEAADNYLSTANVDDGSCTYFDRFIGDYNGTFECEGAVAALLSDAEMKITKTVGGNGIDEVDVVVSNSGSDLVLDLDGVLTRDTISVDNFFEDFPLTVPGFPNLGPFDIKVTGYLVKTGSSMLVGPVNFTITDTNTGFPFSDSCIYTATK